MNTNQRATGRAASMPAGIAFGAAASFLITILLSGVIAWLVDAQKLQIENLGLGIMIQLAAAAFGGAYVASNKVKHRRLLVSAITGMAYFIILLLITALFFGGQYQAVGETALMILCGCMLGAMWTSRTKRSRKTGRRS